MNISISASTIQVQAPVNPGRYARATAHSLIQATGYAVPRKQLLCERVGITRRMQAISHLAIVHGELHIYGVAADPGNIGFIQQPEQCPGATLGDTPG